MEILHHCNLFININKIASKQIQFLIVKTMKKIYIKLNSQTKLFLELEAD